MPVIRGDGTVEGETKGSQQRAWAPIKPYLHLVSCRFFLTWQCCPGPEEKSLLFSRGKRFWFNELLFIAKSTLLIWLKWLMNKHYSVCFFSFFFFFKNGHLKKKKYRGVESLTRTHPLQMRVLVSREQVLGGATQTKMIIAPMIFLSAQVSEG